MQYDMTCVMYSCDSYHKSFQFLWNYCSYYETALVITSAYKKHLSLGLRFYYQWWNARCWSKHTIRRNSSKTLILIASIWQLYQRTSHVCLSCEVYEQLVSRDHSAGQSTLANSNCGERPPNTCCSKRILWYWCGRHCLPSPMVYWL